VAYDFGMAGGCKESKEVIIKAWLSCNGEYRTERRVYEILSASPMKGCPSFIESASMSSGQEIYALVLERLGPSLQDLCNLMAPNVRFDEKMTLALAIQMVCDLFLFTSFSYLSSFFIHKLDRYADLHTRKIIHNGAKPGNICIASPSAADASILNLIDFGFSFFNDCSPLDQGEGHSGNKRFWSILSYHTFSEFLSINMSHLSFINGEKNYYSPIST
jgi:serine/threonine protein kinase